MKKILLSLLLSAPLGVFAQCSELFFSEYVEGTGNNKGVEIYNPTGNSVSLSGYVFQRYSNGSTTVFDSLVLSGTVAPHDVFVIVNGQITTQTVGTSTSPPCDPAMQAYADQLDDSLYPAPSYFNGDDALGLSHNGTVVDIFGKIGEDPGTAWTDIPPYTTAAGGSYITKDHTMIRHHDVMQGVTLNPIAFNSFAEYDTLPPNTWTELGRHVCDCGTLGVKDIGSPTVAVYPNPVQGKQMITISSSANISSIELFTLDGKNVKTLNFDSTNRVVALNVSDLKKNFYLIKTYTVGRHPSTTKIEIQ